MRHLAAVVLALFVGLPASAADDADKPRRSTEQPLADFDADIAKGLKAHGVPGLGIAIVKDGKVIFAKGYGVRTTGQTDPVTEKTLFAIGSVSKSFTAASIAM